MNELVFGCDVEMARWAAERIPHVRGGSFAPCSAIGVARNGRVIASVVYHDFQPRLGTIQLSMAAESPMWARRETIASLLHYPFRQLRVFKLWTAVPIDCEPALKAQDHIGFRREAVLAHHFGHKRHCVIARMLEPDFARLFEKEKNHGKIGTQPAAAA